MGMTLGDTIVAVATPYGQGALAIVRVSGPSTEKIFRSCFRSSKQRPLISHVMNYGQFIDPQTNGVLDDVMCCFMKGPRSYTCEDTLEVYCHGGKAIVEGIMKRVLGINGVRQAEAGEFTFRAFVNGRIDLVQAEAVNDVITSQTESALFVARQQLVGGLSHYLQEIKSELLTVLSHLEVSIDLAFEDHRTMTQQEMEREIGGIIQKLSFLLHGYKTGRFIRSGARVCLVGKPNVGKSSLLNRILGEERAIVSAIPGTTRDPLEGRKTIRGIPFVFWDTAGLHDPGGEVEEIALSRTHKMIIEADMGLLILDASVPLDDKDSLAYKALKGRACYIVLNKMDLEIKIGEKDIPSDWERKEIIEVSAHTGLGIARLEEIISENFKVAGALSEAMLLTNVRHGQTIEKGHTLLVDCLKKLQEGFPEDIIALTLHDVVREIGSLTGETTSEDLVQEIFRQFCIGK